MTEKILFCSEGWNIKDHLPELKALSDERPDFFKNGSLQLVGIYTMEDGTIVYSFPKYMKIKPDKVALADCNHLAIVARVIEKASVDDTPQEFDPYEVQVKKKSIDRIALACSIITDYCQNGIYSEKHSLTGKFSKGKTLWGLTVRKSKPVISDGVPIYHNATKRAVFEKPESLIVELHKRIVRECYDVIHKLEPTHNILMPERSAINDENLQKYENVFLSQLSNVFVQREIELFKMLSAWCGQNSRYYRTIGCTTHFQDVWEAVNDAVWGNTNKQENKSTPPNYFLDKKNYCGIGDAQPDTLRSATIGDKHHLFIFDSKYYVPDDVNKGKIVGYPANSDIVKQIAYYREIMYYIEGHKKEGAEIKYHNFFLLPACLEFEFSKLDGKEFNCIGNVTCGEFTSMRKILVDWGVFKPPVQKPSPEKISVVIVEPDTLYHRYLSGRKISDDELETLLKQYSLQITKTSN